MGGLAHDIQLELQPESGNLIVTDRIGFDEPRTNLSFVLNAGFRIHLSGSLAFEVETGPVLSRYRLTFAQPVREVTLRYEGVPLFARTRGHGGMPQGDLSPQGVYLDGSSAWYPRNNEAIVSFRLHASEPAGWKLLSAGRREAQPGGVIWHSEQPHDDLYLVGGPYTLHQRRHGAIDLSVWLLQDDPGLAQRYLALMGEYIDHYSDLIGPYPFAKFAVVENRWPTGLGMPSFTLLGSQVLRLPFIPYTSLPHEILHNWFGNGIWIDYGAGNWSEGLTAYLADHWMKEREGGGAQYRLRSLQRYSNYAARGEDMPLLDFVSRHNEDTQSVGYSKSLMFFHMLRIALGDQAFDAGLRRLWQQHRFQRIGFVEAMRAIIGERFDLAERFQPWLQREGAPGLALNEVLVRAQGDGYRVELALGQDAVPGFDLDVPVAIELENGERLRRTVRLDRAERVFEIPLDARPKRVRIDPDYDVLRRLDPSEQPPVLSQLFGGATWLVLPTGAPEAEQRAWLRLAQGWQRRYTKLNVIDDSEAARIPAGDNRLVLGWDNQALDPSRLSDREFRLEPGALSAQGQFWPRGRYAAVRVSTDAQGVTTGFIGADGPDLIAALARKLPHYGAYGVLVFDKATADNRFKAVPANPWSKLAREL